MPLPLAILTPSLAYLPDSVLLLALLGISLLLIFAGSKVVKALAFLVVGLVGAAVGGVVGGHFLGPLGALVGLLGGFLIGGFLGLILIRVGIGVVLGYGAYSFTHPLVAGSTLPIFVGLVFFVIGVLFYHKILVVVTAVAGGFLLFDVLRAFGLGPEVSAVVSIAAAAVGIWMQSAGRRTGGMTASQTR